MTHEELGKKLIERCLLHGDFTLSSGKKSHYYFDKYLFETDPELLGETAHHLAARIDKEIKRLAGMELGAIPLVTTVGLETGKSFLLIRKKGKGYGTGAVMEGVYEEGDSVMLLEDVMTTGAQAVKAAKNLAESGLDVKGILCVLNREEGADELAAESGIKLEALFTKSSLGIK